MPGDHDSTLPSVKYLYPDSGTLTDPLTPHGLVWSLKFASFVHGLDGAELQSTNNKGNNGAAVPLS